MHADVATALDRWHETTARLTDAARRLDGALLNVEAHAGGWTNHDLLAHLATGYVVRTSWLERVFAGEDPNVAFDVQRANEESVTRLVSASRDELVDEMLRNRRRIELLLERVEDRHLMVRVKHSDGRVDTLSEAILAFCAHDEEHLAELGRAR